MILMAYKDAKDVAALLYCCGDLEEKAFSLYRILSDKVENSIVKSLLLFIAYDSLKHGFITRGIAETISKDKPKPEDCERKMKPVSEKIAHISQEVLNRQKVSDNELLLLIQELAGFENSLSEEYLVHVQAKTLEHMTKEIAQTYKVDLSGLKNIFKLIVKDEENHVEILNSIEELFDSEETERNNTPVVRYQHPEAW